MAEQPESSQRGAKRSPARKKSPVRGPTTDVPDNQSRTHSRGARTPLTPAGLLEANSSVRKRKLHLTEFIRRHLKQGAVINHYELWELDQLLKLAKASFQASSTLLEFSADVIICGDIHGQFVDLIRIFEACGAPGKTRYLFLGDYVDRGRHSLEVIVLLLACKIRYPRQVYLLRGNHEVKKINNLYGFKGELQRRYKEEDWSPLYNHFNEVFAEMPLAALISQKVLCMHGGLSPELNSLDDIRNIKRPIHMLPRGIIQDLLWSDPDAQVQGFQPNKVRFVSVLFGEDAVHQKLKQLNIQLIVRAHQVVEYGYAFFASQKLITVFSASRYYEDVCNWGAVLKLDKDLEMTFKIFKPHEYHAKKQSKALDTADEDEEPQQKAQQAANHQQQMPPPSAAQEAVVREASRE